MSEISCNLRKGEHVNENERKVNATWAQWINVSEKYSAQMFRVDMCMFRNWLCCGHRLKMMTGTRSGQMGTDFWRPPARLDGVTNPQD
jgi:hypothetical protein